MSQTLESMARALFKSWFVDFDPVRAKSEGRDPGLPQHLARLFPADFVDSEIGPIPDGWRVEALGSHVTSARGVSYNGSGLASGGMPMHNLNSVYEGGGYKDAGIKFYAGEHRPQHVARPGDLIVANTEQGHHRLLIGYAAIVPDRYPTGLFSHHLYRVQAVDGSPLSSEFLCWLLNSDVMHETVSGYANGTTVNMLPLAALQRTRTCVPPEQLIRAFTAFCRQLRRRSEGAFDSCMALAALRDAQLARLVSGDLQLNTPARTAEALSA
jgi:type I restriction enzyme S subunit